MELGRVGVGWGEVRPGSAAVQLPAIWSGTAAAASHATAAGQRSPGQIVPLTGSALWAVTPDQLRVVCIPRRRSDRHRVSNNPPLLSPPHPAPTNLRLFDFHGKMTDGTGGSAL